LFGRTEKPNHFADQTRSQGITFIRRKEIDISFWFHPTNMVEELETMFESLEKILKYASNLCQNSCQPRERLGMFVIRFLGFIQCWNLSEKVINKLPTAVLMTQQLDKLNFIGLLGINFR